MPTQVTPSHGNPQMRLTLFGGYLFKYCSVKYQIFTKYLSRHPSKHIRTKKTPEKLSRCPKSHKTTTNLSDRAYFREFLIGRRGILVIPRNPPGQSQGGSIANVNLIQLKAKKLQSEMYFPIILII